MVSLVLLILAPVVLAALILGGTLIFSSKPNVNTNPNVPKLSITASFILPPSSIIFTTRVLPEKGKDVATAKVPDVTSAVAVTSFKIPEISKASNAVNTKVDVTTKVVPSVVTSKVVSAVTTKVLDIVKPKFSETTKTIAVPTAIVPYPSTPTDGKSKGDNKQNENNKDKKKGDNESEEDEEQDWKDDDDWEDEEEEDESPIINGTTGIQAADPTNGHSVETVKFESRSGNSDSKRNAKKDKNNAEKDFKKRFIRMKRSVTLKQESEGLAVHEQLSSVTNNNNDKSVMDELTARLDKIVEEQSAPFEAQLERIRSDLLDCQTAAEYSDVLHHIQSRQHQRQQQQQEEEPAATENQDTNAAQKSFHAQAFIIQFRTDVRNTVIFICGGQHDGLIDGKVNGDDDYARKAAQDDITATTHPDGVYIRDLYDPQNGALAPECLKTHFGQLVTALGKLLSTRFAGLREYLLGKVAALAGIPRFFIPFSQDGDKRASFVEQSIDELSEEEKERIQRSAAFAQ
ncbi:hypothetical protein BGW39_003735 [Mortierella sp. 14UC]|nr:hypothetical protein BGW39_003735 [Mortierella sp. 14UC]